MAKREIPLFIIDTSRAHGRGECDFIVCTDRDSGFIARADYINEEREEAGDNYRIGCPRNGISLRLQIVQHTGANIRDGDVRTLLKRGMDYYVRAVTKPMDVGSPSRHECAEFLRTLAMGNMHNIDAAGSDYTQRQTSCGLYQCSRHRPTILTVNERAISVVGLRHERKKKINGYTL